MSKLTKKTINDLKTLKTVQRHERKLERLKANSAKAMRKLEQSGLTHKEKQKTIRNLQNTSAITGLGLAAADTAQEKVKAARDTEMARINALINGNTHGINEIDPDKPGEQAQEAGGSSTTNYFQGW